MPFLAIINVLLLAAGCGGPGGKDEAWMPSCDETLTPLGLSEVSALGFSADDLLAELTTSASADLAWTAGDSTTLTIGLSPGAEAWFVDLEPAEPPDDVDVYADIGVICDDSLRLDASIALTTDDGLLSDSFDTSLSAMAVDSASFSVDADRTDFAHPEIFDPFATGDYDAESVSIDGELLSGGETTGALFFQTEGTDGETAWAASDMVAEWGALE